jgi:hypothetical protein
MTPERWEQVERLFHRALGRPAAECAKLLETACAGDDELQREVESLLKSSDEAGNFIENRSLGLGTGLPRLNDPAEGLSLQAGTAPMAGRMVGHYRVHEKLGERGIGEVYEAEDTRVGRNVALKFLPESMAKDRQALERFQREARAGASLVDKSLLLQCEQVGDEARFRMLKTIREYAAELLTTSGEEAAMRRAHAADCLVLAEEDGFQLPGSQRQLWLNQLDLEQASLRAALDWLIRAGSVEWGLRLATALQIYKADHASPAERRGYLSALLDLPVSRRAEPDEGAAKSSARETAAKKLRASALVALSDLALEQGGLPFARTVLEEALAIYFCCRGVEQLANS